MLYHLVSLAYILSLTNTTSKKVASFGESSLAFKVMFNCFEFKLNYPDIIENTLFLRGRFLYDNVSQQLQGSSLYFSIYFHLFLHLYSLQSLNLWPLMVKRVVWTARFFKGGFGVFRDRVNHLEVLMGTKAGQTKQSKNPQDMTEEHQTGGVKQQIWSTTYVWGYVLKSDETTCTWPWSDSIPFFCSPPQVRRRRDMAVSQKFEGLQIGQNSSF